MSNSEVVTLITGLMGLIPSQALSEYRKILSIEGGVELLSKIISTTADPSEVSEERIQAEWDRMKSSSEYGWAY